MQVQKIGKILAFIVDRIFLYILPHFIAQQPVNKLSLKIKSTTKYNYLLVCARIFDYYEENLREFGTSGVEAASPSVHRVDVVA